MRLAPESMSHSLSLIVSARSHLVAGILSFAPPVILSTPRVCFFVRKQASWASDAAGNPKNLTTWSRKLRKC